MDTLTTIAVGITARAVIFTLCAHQIKLGAALCGLCDGAILHRSLRTASPQSLRPYFQPAFAFVLDFFINRSLDRSIIVWMGTGLGVLLADIGPDLWYELGGDGIARDLGRLWSDLSYSLFPGEASRHTHFTETRRPALPSPPSSTVSVSSRSVRSAMLSSIPEIPEPFDPKLEETSDIHSRSSTPIVQIENALSEQLAHLRSPSTLTPRTDEVEEGDLYPNHDDHSGTGDSTPKARPIRLSPEVDRAVSPVSLDERRPLTPQSISRDAPSFHAEEHLGGRSLPSPLLDVPNIPSEDDLSSSPIEGLDIPLENVLDNYPDDKEVGVVPDPEGWNFSADDEVGVIPDPERRNISSGDGVEVTPGHEELNISPNNEEVNITHVHEGLGISSEDEGLGPSIGHEELGIPPDAELDGPSPLRPNSDELDLADVNDLESVISGTESVLSNSPKEIMLLRAQALRKEADAAVLIRSNLERERVQAEKERMWSQAFALKFQRDEADEKAQTLHRRAERRYYAANNPSSDEAKIDVHYLKVPEAIKRTEKALRQVQKNGGQRLRVIVGRGNHSPGRIPVLRQAVIRAISR